MTQLATAPRLFGTRKHLWLTAGLMAGGVAVVLVGMILGAGDAVNAVVLDLREAGPLLFFTAMALLPAVGFPMMLFTLSAGPVFAPEHGPGWVIVWSVAAVVVNLLLSYWLADRALRPLVGRLLAWCGFALPAETPAGPWQLTLIVRLMPGPPFWAQSYLLGLLRVSLGPYLVVSTAIMTGYIVALVFGGVAITEGNGGLAFAAVGFLVIAVAARQLWRKHVARRFAADHPVIPAE
jgi:uncharacterized membrane protein YdjX (TVP38/TMEM64 family)